MDRRRGVLVGLVVAALGACSNNPPGRTYYQRNIEPILQQKCGGNTSGCHQPNPDDPYQFVAGNFDVSSFQTVQKRRDVLTRFGPYPYPLLLIKAVAPATHDPNNPNQLQVQYGTDAMGNPQFRPIDVLHVGGAVITVGSDAYYTLQTWLQNGATENGLAPPTPPQTGNGTCSSAVPSGFDPSMYMANPNFQTFKDKVQPVFNKHGCTSSNCHGAPESDFYITCGGDDTQLAFNFSQAWSFVDNPVDDSQLLKVPLAVAAGGRGHTGGDQFPSTDDGDYKALHDWAQQVGVLGFANGDPVKQFFADNVQPLLVQRGCSFEACHSPEGNNDLNLRSGTQGFFSAVSLEKNYDLLKNQFMAFELPDARRSRAVAKTISKDDYRVTGVGGIDHRGGEALESPGTVATPGQPSDPALCGTWNAATSTAFCTFQEWVNRERAQLLAAGQASPMNTGDTLPIVYIDRPAGQNADRLDFDKFQGGAKLMVVTATFGADFGQKLSVTGTPTDLLADPSCAGAIGGDIGGPDVAGDGDSVAFAARPSASVGWSIWRVSISTGQCSEIVPSAGTIHNFDPAWSPDGAYIVFASTRGKNGPTLSRKRFLPQSDLWRIHLADGTLEQMTFLSNSEINPQFMREGRVIMSTEKVSDGFYQISGRRQNWDLTDYHPLLGQRKSSAYPDPTNPDPTKTNPSIGYSAATDIREGADGNFMLILYDVNPDGTPVVNGGAGMLATFNRSIGPFEDGRNDPGFFKSLKIVDPNPAANGHAGATAGYRSPFYLPDGQIMASYAPDASALAWQIVAVSPRTGVQTPMITPAAGRAVCDAVLAYKYPPRPFYLNHRQLVFGGSVDTTDPMHAVVTMPDAPMLFTVLTGNLRRGRPVDAFRAAKYLAVYSEGMCPTGGCTANTDGIYQSRNLLGKAPLASDGSVKVQLPSETGVVFELDDGNNKPVVTMTEEHQLGPGEHISMGVPESLFNAVCGGCHGSVSGKETDIAVTPDALTGASQSISLTATAKALGN